MISRTNFSPKYALENLFSLGILDEDCNLTEDGKKIATIPLQPRLAKCLLSSVELGCSVEILTIAAMCSVRNPFVSLKDITDNSGTQSRFRLQKCKKHFRSDEGDHLTLLNIYNECERTNFDKSWCISNCIQYNIMEEARNIRAQLEKYLYATFEGDRNILRSSELDSSIVLQCLVTGYFANAAKLASDGMYETVVGKQKINLHSTSTYLNDDTRCGLPEWIIFHEIVYTKHIGNARILSKVDPRWFLELKNHYYRIEQCKGIREVDIHGKVSNTAAFVL